ncbi:MAG: L-lactate permease, partial [bacterium]
MMNQFSTTGTSLLIAGLIAGLLLGLKPSDLFATYVRTLRRVGVSLLTISLMLALGFRTRVSGTGTTSGLAWASG